METATQALSSHQIASHISAARDLIIGLEHDAHNLAYPAVSGDQNAVASLADIQAQIRQANADIAVLELAKEAAISKEIAAEKAKDQAYRDRHFEVAKQRAVEIVKLARRADDLVAECKAVFVQIGATEREIWNALREADAPPNGAIVGRKNLGDFAIASLTAFTNGTDRFRQLPAAGDVAMRAWAHLLTDEGACDE